MISVIMGIHRFDEYVEDSIISILNQTYKEFEMIIVANGSEASEVASAIQRLFPNEPRIKILTSQIGQLSHALNIGIDASAFEYIARMDSDDISHPERLQKQLDYLVKNNLDVVGCDINLINENGEIIGTQLYPKGSDINKKLTYKNCFAHNTVLMKKSFLLKVRGYNAGYNSEDYDLWLRMRRAGVSWDNMDEILLDYRIHESASQGRLLGYAEVSGYILREFLLAKTLSNFIGVFINIGKALFKADRSKSSY